MVLKNSHFSLEKPVELAHNEQFGQWYSFVLILLIQNLLNQQISSHQRKRFQTMCEH